MSIIELDSKVKELRELRHMAEELAAEIEAIQDTIKAHLDGQGMDTITGSDWKITYKTINSSRINTTALSKALPDVAERFTRQTSSRRFVLA